MPRLFNLIRLALLLSLIGAAQVLTAQTGEPSREPGRPPASIPGSPGPPRIGVFATLLFTKGKQILLLTAKRFAIDIEGRQGVESVPQTLVSCVERWLLSSRHRRSYFLRWATDLQKLTASALPVSLVFCSEPGCRTFRRARTISNCK
jgi:hypothetical protein